MALRQYDINPGQDKVGVAETGTVTAVTGGASSLGGTIQMRLIIDDAVAPSRQEVLRAMLVLEQRIIEDTYPPS